MGPTEGVRGQVSGVRPGHAKGRGHAFPAMTGLAGKIGDLVHGQDGRWKGLSYPLNETRGERDEKRAKGNGIGAVNWGMRGGVLVYGHAGRTGLRGYDEGRQKRISPREPENKAGDVAREKQDNGKENKKSRGRREKGREGEE